MKKFRVYSFFDHRDSYNMSGDLRVHEVREVFKLKDFNGSPGFIFWGPPSFEESTTYEEMVRIFIEDGRLLPLDDPRLHYNIVLQVFEAAPLRSISKPVIFREGQTLASTRLTHLIHDESESEHLRGSGKPFSYLYCAISIEIRDFPPPKSKSPSSDEGIKAFLASPTVGMIEFISAVIAIAVSPIAIIQLLTAVSKSWSKIQSTAGPDIIAIRLQMTDRTQHRFVEWLTDPDRLKQYIDVFNQPSSSVKPLQAIFVLKKDGPIIIDVSEGAQSNLQLDEILSYLHIDSAGK